MSAHLHDISGSDQATLSAVRVEDAVAAGMRAALGPVFDIDTGSCLGHMTRVAHSVETDGVCLSFADGSRLIVRVEAL